MACVSAARKAEIKLEIEDIDALIVIVKEVYKASLTGAATEEYRFDSGDGSQKTIRRKPSEVKQEWDALVADRNSLIREYNGTRNVSLNFSRRAGCCK